MYARWSAYANIWPRNLGPLRLPIWLVFVTRHLISATSNGSSSAATSSRNLSCVNSRAGAAAHGCPTAGAAGTGGAPFTKALSCIEYSPFVAGSNWHYPPRATWTLELAGQRSGCSLSPLPMAADSKSHGSLWIGGSSLDGHPANDRGRQQHRDCFDVAS